MTPAPRHARGGAVLLALAIGACGPYADVAQKLDVTARVAGDTWLAVAGPDQSEVRVLLVGDLLSDGSVAFAFTAMHMPISRGSTAITLQGRWTEVGSSGDTTLHVEHEYTLPDEWQRRSFSRRGTWRDDVSRTIALTVTRDARPASSSREIRGSPGLRPARRGARAARLRDRVGRRLRVPIANLGIRSSEVRIIGFGGPGMSQYHQAETYVGTVAGSPPGLAHRTTQLTTTIQYDAFEDLGGVRVSGPQITYADWEGTARWRACWRSPSRQSGPTAPRSRRSAAPSTTAAPATPPTPSKSRTATRWEASTSRQSTAAAGPHG